MEAQHGSVYGRPTVKSSQRYRRLQYPLDWSYSPGVCHLWPALGRVSYPRDALQRLEGDHLDVFPDGGDHAGPMTSSTPISRLRRASTARRSASSFSGWPSRSRTHS
jgi:hypothetical protein